MYFTSIRNVFGKILVLCCGAFIFPTICPGQNLGYYSLGGDMFVGSSPVVSWQLSDGATAMESLATPYPVLNFSLTFPVLAQLTGGVLTDSAGNQLRYDVGYSLGGRVTLENAGNRLVIEKILIVEQTPGSGYLIADFTYNGVKTPRVLIAVRGHDGAIGFLVYTSNLIDSFHF